MGNSSCCMNGSQQVDDEESQTKAVKFAETPGGTTEKKLDSEPDSKKSKEQHKRRRTATKGMTRLTMKFPKIRHSFRECKKVFDAKVGDKDGLSKSEMKSLLIELGADSEHLTDSELTRIFKTANLDGDDDIDFKEFLIAAAVGCFLNEDIDHEEQSEDFKKIRNGFLVAKEAFDFIDKDGGGSIDFEELRMAFSSMKQDDATVRARLKELDFNEDDDISFPEFVYGITAWVGMDPDEDGYIVDTTGDENALLNVGDAQTPRHRLSQENADKLMNPTDDPQEQET